MDQRPILFFDVDDRLYPKSLGMEKYINELVDKFLMNHLSLSAEEAARLNEQYFRDHNLTVIGLYRMHNIDPLLYNSEVDNALPLDSLLVPDTELQAVLGKFDKSKVKLWLLTNAYIEHGLRVVKLLGIEKYFEGITYCDYKTGLWPCKPHQEMFAKAEREAGASQPGQCFFVDDSPRNCQAAYERGWNVVRILDPKMPLTMKADSQTYATINHLDQLHHIFPQLRADPASSCTTAPTTFMSQT